jgi:hypothetical protein
MARSIEVAMELLKAAYNGNVAEARRLVATGVDVNAEDEDGRPLHLQHSMGTWRL